MKTMAATVALLCSALIIHLNAKDIAYIHGDIAADGTIPSGTAAAYDQMLLSDTGPKGLSQFKSMVQSAGYAITQHYDANTTLNATFLNQFDVVIFGLHQKIWSSAEKSALDTWLRAGGGALFYSDSAAGGHYGTVGAQNPVGQTAVNNVISQYGMQVLVDQANGIKAFRAGPVATHPIVEGRPILEGEGVSPVAVDPNSNTQVLIPYVNHPDYMVSGLPTIAHTQNMTISNPQYAALATVDVGSGRLVVMFDRQPMWNDGPGSDIDKRDNREVLRRVVRYLAGDLGQENQIPSADFMTPQNGDTILQSDTLHVEVNATDADGTIVEVRLYLDGVFLRKESVYPYQWSDAELQGLGVGSHTLTAVAVDQAGAEASKTINITITDDMVTYLPIPGRIEAEDYKEGGEGVGYHDTTSGNSGGKYRIDNVDIQSTNDAGGGFNVGWIASGEWLAYDIDVAHAGGYSVTCRVASAQTGNKTLRLEVDGADVTGPITFNTGGAGWQMFEDVVVIDVPLPAGECELRIVMESSGFNVNYIDIQPAEAPTVSFASIGNGDVFSVGADLYVKVNAIDNGSISNVKLYINDAFVRQENHNPYEWQASKDTALANMQAGTYVLKAVATDDEGLTGAAQITITVGSN